jgi:hypothetical protein
MIKILLEHGADKTATVEDLYLPVDLLSSNRTRAKKCESLASLSDVPVKFRIVLQHWVTHSTHWMGSCPSP